jgi:hypothetical protein
MHAGLSIEHSLGAGIYLQFKKQPSKLPVIY